MLPDERVECRWGKVDRGAGEGGAAGGDGSLVEEGNRGDFCVWIGGDGADDLLEVDGESTGCLPGESAAVALEVTEGVVVPEDHVERELKHGAVAIEVDGFGAEPAGQFGTGSELFG